MNNTSDDDIECVYECKKTSEVVHDSSLLNSDSSFNDSSTTDSASRFKQKYDESFDTKSNHEDEIESDDEETPSGPECLKRCKEFAEITGTDRALAMFYLQNNKWNLQKSLDSYFRSTGGPENKSKIVACFDVEKLDEDERKENINKKQKTLTGVNTQLNYCKSHTDQIVSTNSIDIDEYDQDEKNQEEDDKHFKIMSWNIDGLDKGNLENRTLGTINIILKEKPDVILLQEVIKVSEKLLREKLSSAYELITGESSTNLSSQNSLSYYTAVLVKKKTCKINSKNLIDFENSKMGRNLLDVKLLYKNLVKLCVMTSHLESTADYSKERTEQLRKCFSHMIKQDKDMIVLFGGDLNLRDSELSAIGGPPKDVYDIWESTGKRKECIYTWDCMRNTNLKMNGKFKPRCRFDRLFYRPYNSLEDMCREVETDESKDLTLMPVYFELEGLEKLKSCGRFCSDHWAIQAYLKLESRNNIK